MAKKAYLVLEDGAIFEGQAFGAETEKYGEVVFTTSMTGYQEALTDPSFAGQIVVPTYPLIGNYGINRQDIESRRIQVAGFVVRQECRRPSHGSSILSLHEYLQAEGVPGIAGVDTRSITRRIRTRGVMMGVLCYDNPEEALARHADEPPYDERDFVKGVSATERYTYSPEVELAQNASRLHLAISGATPMRSITASVKEPATYRIVATDYGIKYNISRLVHARGCEVIVVPATATAEEILALSPDGVLLSPGPGDPRRLDYVVETVRGLVGHMPIFGICLGHQTIGMAFGGKIFKLKFGHRGANHPVKDLVTGRVHITAQNHGYAVDAEGLPPELEVTHINLNDNTVEGLRHRELPIMTIQYHSEASPGPKDNEYMFDRFLDLVRENSPASNRR